MDSIRVGDMTAQVQAEARWEQLKNKQREQKRDAAAARKRESKERADTREAYLQTRYRSIDGQKAKPLS